MIKEMARAPLETRHGRWTQILYWDGLRQSIAMQFGDVAQQENVMVRLHSSCVNGTFMTVECDCTAQFDEAMARISKAGRGVIVWLDQEGRGNGILAFMLARQIKEDSGRDPAGGWRLSDTEAYAKAGYPMDNRNFEAGARILLELGIRSVVLLTNNAAKLEALEQLGLPAVAGSERLLVDSGNPFVKKRLEDNKRHDHSLL